MTWARIQKLGSGGGGMVVRTSSFIGTTTYCSRFLSILACLRLRSVSVKNVSAVTAARSDASAVESSMI